MSSQVETQSNSTTMMATTVEVESMMAKVALDCGGDISSSQEDILARSSFLRSQSQDQEEKEEELFTTPPLTQQDPITMCTLPFTPSPAPSSGDDDMALVKPRRKPRVCTRKVRGAKIRTPTPSPKQQQQQEVDPLYTAVLMIPTTTTNNNKQSPVEDFVALARQRGLL